jgi:hypothetical protein
LPSKTIKNLNKTQKTDLSAVSCFVEEQDVILTVMALTPRISVSTRNIDQQNKNNTKQIFSVQEDVERKVLPNVLFSKKRRYFPELNLEKSRGSKEELRTKKVLVFRSSKKMTNSLNESKVLILMLF